MVPGLSSHWGLNHSHGLLVSSFLRETGMEKKQVSLVMDVVVFAALFTHLRT